MPILSIAGTRLPIQEINRRLAHDREYLANRLPESADIINLPDMRPDDHFGSLDRAAVAFVDKGYDKSRSHDCVGISTVPNGRAPGGHNFLFELPELLLLSGSEAEIEVTVDE
jgi:hypothetical protein